MEEKTINTELELLTVKEVAEWLKISEKTVYSWLCNSGSKGGSKRNKLPDGITIKLGRSQRFVKKRLLKWLENGARLGAGT